MNKIFKVIFNRATGKLVVVSELTKSHGKAASSTDERSAVSSFAKFQHQAKAALMLGLLGASSMATALTEGTATGNGVAIGSSSTAAQESVAIGSSSNAVRYGVAIGQGAKGENGEQSVAIGQDAQALGAQSIALGGNTRATGASSIAIGGDDANGTDYHELIYNSTTGKVERRAAGDNTSLYTKPTASGAVSVSIGVKAQATGNGTSALGVLATASGKEAIALGAMSASKGERSIALGAGSTASGNKAFAAGDGSLASASNSIAIGSNANASAVDTTALGANSTSSGIHSTALGKGSTANATDTVAVGQGAQATAENATSMGSGAIASAKNSVAIGQGASASNSDVGSIALGKNANSSAKGTLAIGTSSIANATYAHAYGDTMKVYAERAIGIGLASTIGTGSTNATLLGSHATIGENAVRAVSVGSGNNVSSANATALGSGITIGTGLANAVVLGANSGTGGSHSIANETSATVNGVSYSNFAGTVNSTGNFVSVGTNATGGQRKIINVAAGNVSSTSTEAINGSQLYMVANELKNQIGTGSGSSIKYFSVKSTETNNQNNNGASGNNAIAIGPNATAGGNQAIAIGLNSTSATGKANTVAIGRDANVSDDSGTAIGNSARSAKDALALGVLANATAERATAVGPVANALAGNATAVGNEANASAAFATAIGDKAVANISRGVALGAGSVTTRGIPTESGYDVSTGAASSDTSTTWRANTAAVSVGNSTNTRQIVNVAAGSADTDAVNVAQLKKVTANAASATRAYNFTIANGETALANNSGTADNWTLSSDDTLSFGATSNLSVTTDGAGKIVYDLSSTFADKINNIETTANNANTTATAANNTANDAKTVADTANTAAAEAKDAADAANTTANTANTTANNAKTAADTALITADKANATANDANATANAANATANDANATANAANATANDANATANAANATANDANATANTANATANDANATANTANATANDANATANTANNTANTAQAGVDTLNARKYTFNVKNGANALTNDGKAQEWQLNADNSVTFGATSYLNVTTDAAGNIIYDLSESSKTALTAAGAGADGKDGSTGATGAASKGATAQDGLNGKDLTTKVNALRNGEAGPVVYTDAEGNRLVKANDGKYYPADEVDEKGEPLADAKAVDSPIASVVNPDGTTTKPTTMGNVKSNIGPNNGDAAITEDAAKNAVAGADGKSGLLSKTGAELNNVATVGDLQAIAQAGLDFTGNNNETVHRPLGTKLTVVGERDDNKTSYTADESAKNNLIVEADKANNTLTVKMAKELKNLKSIEASDSIKVGTDNNGVNITPNGTTTTATAADGTSVVSNLTANGTTIVEKDATGTPTGKEAAYTLDGSKVAVKDPATGETKETTMDADGTHATVKDAQGNPTKSADYTADGSTVKAVDPTTDEAKESTYGADGLSAKALDKDGNVTGETTVTPEGVNLYGKDGKDGQDAKPVASLTNTVDAEGKNNPSLAFAKDGEGDDAKGTGTITGLKDVERNPDGTAKDRTQAANTGYVDDRLEDMDAGKPFEYFTKDADGKDVKVVRGKDGKFYTEDELAGKTYDPATNGYKDADGKEVTPTVDSANVTIKAMPNTNEMALGNIKSTIGLNGKDATGADLGPITADAAKDAVAGADGKSGLLSKTGAELNNVATVGDLQAIAQAGLDFTGNNSDTTVHRPLGTKLTVVGERDDNKTSYTADESAKNNLIVEADEATNTLTVKMAKELKNLKSIEASDSIKVGTDKNGVNITPNGTTTTATDADGKVTTSTLGADGTSITGPDGKSAEYKLDGSKVAVKDPATGETKETTMDADGTHATVKDAQGNSTKSADYTADGSTVKAVDPATGEAKESTYGADGLSTKALDKDGNVTSETTVTPEGVNLYGKDGKDGQDAKPVASLTNTVDAEGKNNPSLAFAKDGEGDDAKGTGTITGLKDVERNPDGTAKDRTQAANTGYVDDRLADMDAGKPFEYFTKDADGKDVKVVRGKDGNFYTEDELAGKTYDPATNSYKDADGNEVKPTVDSANVTIKAMPNTNEMALGNIKSTIGLNGKDATGADLGPITADAAKDAVAGTDGKSGLLAKKGAELNNVATVGDLQAIAQAGLDFTGNNAAENKDVHRPLGTKLTIEGETTTANQTKESFGATAANNIHVESKGDENKLVISLTEDLKGINSVDFKPAEITNPDGTTTYAKANISSKGNTYTETDKDGKAVENGKTASYGLNGTKMEETDANGNKSVSTTTAKGTDIKETAKDGSEKTASYKVDGTDLKETAADGTVKEAGYKVDGTELKETAADGTEKAASYKVDGTTLEEVAADGTEKSAEYKVDGSKVTVVDPTTGETKETTMDADGTHATVKDKDGNPTKSADYTADGSTVKAVDPTTGEAKESTYGADGLSTKALDKDGNVTGETTVTPEGVNLYGKDGKDGQDAKPVASLTNTVDAEGKNNPSLAFAKDGEGDDAKGTGTITGLKDVERNLDGTAKDRTQAANTGYVDDRLADMDAGKPFEYFDEDGNQVVRGKDGKFYDPKALEGKVYDPETNQYYPAKADGTADTAQAPVATGKPASDVVIKAMPNEAGPVAMGNVGSGLGLDAYNGKPGADGKTVPAKYDATNADDVKAAQGAADKLYALDGDKLNNVVTAGDLQALAVAGLDFTGNNNGTTVHRALGSKLTVEGEGAWNGQNSAADNLYVQADAANNKLVVKMNENLTGINSVDFKPTEITNSDGSKTYAKSTISSAGNTYVETDKDGNAVANGKSATYGLNGSSLADGKGNVTNMTAAGTNVVDAAGNTANYGANGSTVADAAGNTANYGANGLTVADKDGNPAITLLNNASGPSLNFAKNADGTGTGKITGVAAGDISPDSTDVVTGAQVYALSGGNTVTINPADGSTTSTAKDKDGNIIMTTDENGNQVEKQYTLTTYNVEGQTEFVTNSVITAVHNMNEQGIKFFHTNDAVATPINQASNSIDSSASGAYATAVGYQAKADGTNAIAMGKGATAAGENSIAIGTGNQVLANKAGAFGDPNIIEQGATGSYAIGNDNVITSSNTFVLGNDVNNSGNVNGQPVAMGNTVENSVYLGNKSTATAGDGSRTGTLKNRKQDGSEGTTTTAGSTGTVSSAKVGNMTYGGFAGAKADGVVSVGAAGNERRVQNVAAGEISATSTDAINGSQLYSVAQGVDKLDGKVNRMNRKLRSGIAAATAMTNIPQVTMPGKSALGAGVGSYDGQGALAVGYSRMSDSGRVIFKVSAGATTQGKYNAGAGVALQW